MDNIEIEKNNIEVTKLKKKKINFAKINDENKKIIKLEDNEVLLEIEVVNEKGIKSKTSQWYTLDTVKLIEE